MLFVYLFCLAGLVALWFGTPDGFSLRILVDMLEAPTSAVDVDYLTANYSSGRGLVWMYRKRIDDIVAARFVGHANKSVMLTAKGEMFAELFINARRLLGVELPQ